MRNIKLIILTIIISGVLTSCTTLSNPDIEKLNARANELMQAGDVDGAIARLVSINDLNPNYAQTHYNLGVAYHKKENYEKAVEELNLAIKLNPGMGNAYFTLGVVYEDHALKLGGDSIGNENAPFKPEIKEAIIFDNKSAVECYKNYLKLTPNATDAGNIRSKIELLQTELQQNQAVR